MLSKKERIGFSITLKVKQSANTLTVTISKGCVDGSYQFRSLYSRKVAETIKEHFKQF